MPQFIRPLWKPEVAGYLVLGWRANRNCESAKLRTAPGGKVFKISHFRSLTVSQLGVPMDRRRFLAAAAAAAPLSVAAFTPFQVRSGAGVPSAGPDPAPAPELPDP